MATRVRSKIPGQTKNSRDLFLEYFKSRPDIGFGKLLLDIAFEPRNTFKLWEPRKLKKGFVAAVLFLLMACAWFRYFSLAR
jgi:hypothetical protein